MTAYFLGLMLVLSIGLIVYGLWPKGGDEEDTIKRRMAGRKQRGPDLEGTRQKAKESVAKRVMKTVAPIAVHPAMKQNAEEMSRLRMKLANAGFRGENAPTTFLASKSVVAVCLGVAGLAFALAKGYSAPNIIGVLTVAAGLGFLAPDLWLSSAAGKRKEQIRRGLPDTLDMLVISVEAGLGLDAGFQRVGDEMKQVHPILAEELRLVTLESQMGIPRSEALTNLTTRTGLDEVRSLVAVVNQAERFGTSIARALRNQSDALRVKRRQAAEEKAQKTTVKLMAPLILFIFPAILVVLAGPAALKMIEALGNTPGLM
ncbi:MAG: type II secretion system F family protein [Phycisphaerae bacterium]|jgi:tight adherence protein C